MYCLEFAGEDDAFAAREAESAAAGVEIVAAGLGLAGGVDPDRIRSLAYTHRAIRLLGRTDASVESAAALLSAALDPHLDPDTEATTVAVRARNVRSLTGVSTAEAERELGGVLVERGYEVDLDDPDRVIRVVFSRSGDDGPSDGADGDGDDSAVPVPTGTRGGDDGAGTGDRTATAPHPSADGVCAVGWVAAESVRDFGDRKPTDRPFFQPGSMSPLDGRAFANVAGARPGATIVDPMCGTGGVLVEAGLVGARPVGIDAQAKMARGARENLAYYLPRDVPFDVVRGDATRLPLADDDADGVVFDAPYGRQSKIERHSLSDLVGGALAEAARIAPRCVMVADRRWRTAALDAGWRVDDLFERRVHRSLTRYVHVLDRE